MITVKTNIAVVSGNLIRKLESLRNPKPLLRTVAFAVLSMITERIHEDGKAADGSDIGTYSSGYLKKRQKKPFNRTSSSKIVASLTRRLENDWAVIATERGHGIGFLNSQKGKKGEPTSGEKMKYVEQVKGKKIAMLTKGERAYAVNKLTSLVKEELDK